MRAPIPAVRDTYGGRTDPYGRRVGTVYGETLRAALGGLAASGAHH
ncbi:hypothetical protein ACFWBX_21795 [Streptomyces sp. NPDC059991]